MKSILIAAIATLSFVAVNARAEGPNAVEPQASSYTSRQAIATVNTGSDAYPVSVGSEVLGLRLVGTDTGSETVPRWAAPIISRAFACDRCN